MPVQIPYVRRFDVAYGERLDLSPRVACVVCENPGPFTFTGTNSFLIGDDDGPLAVIDPGPDDARHLEALLAAIAGRPVSHILLTHTHRDHAPLAPALARATGAPIAGAPPPRRETHASSADEGEMTGFTPDILLTDGDVLSGPDWTLETVATPGHASNHLCFALAQEKALIAGDHVMGWSTTVVAPPDGDMAAYMTSLDRVIAGGYARLYPAHGASIDDPPPFLEAYRAHRLDREAQILAALEGGADTIPEIVQRLYAEVDPRLWPAAGLSVFAHLIKLAAEARVTAAPAPELDARYGLAVRP
jgi:glyoxylase-like metal-dependent hydrolase (beta-lactamase superfamily II)